MLPTLLDMWITHTTTPLLLLAICSCLANLLVIAIVTLFMIRCRNSKETNGLDDEPVMKFSEYFENGSFNNISKAEEEVNVFPELIH